jgi:hypothetical protein
MPLLDSYQPFNASATAGTDAAASCCGFRRGSRAAAEAVAFSKARAERRYRGVVIIIVMLPTTKQSITAIIAVTSTQPLPAWLVANEQRVVI